MDDLLSLMVTIVRDIEEERKNKREDEKLKQARQLSADQSFCIKPSTGNATVVITLS